jgi:hypothetical protein
MNNTLFLPIIILVLIAILFILVSLNSRKIDITKKKKIVEALYTLKDSAKSEELAIRRDTIIKLDNLLSKSLQMYFKNNLQCGENLKLAKKIFKKKAYNSVWEVHKLRNKVIHDDYQISLEESKNAFEVYKINILKVLQ